MSIEKYISIAICIAVIAAVAVACSRSPCETADVAEFRLSTQGMRMYSGFDYTAKASEGRAVIIIRFRDEPEENTVEFMTDLTIMEELRKIIIENNLLSWDGFNKSNKHILDGNSFTMKFRLADGTTAHAHGYHMWPKNYRSVEEVIERVFKKAYEKYAPLSTTRDP